MTPLMIARNKRRPKRAKIRKKKRRTTRRGQNLPRKNRTSEVGRQNRTF